MMSSSLTVSYPRIDHRTVLKNQQIATNNNHNNSNNYNYCCNACKEVTTIGKAFGPITNTKENEKTTAVSAETNTNLSIYTTTLTSIATPSRTYVTRPTTVGTVAPRTKIPFPLATLYSYKKSNHFKRSSPLRLRGTNSNLPLIMEPTISETPTTDGPTTTNATNAAEEVMKCNGNTKNMKNTKNTNVTTTETGGLLFSSRRKLDGNVAESTLKRSPLLHKNYNFNNTNNNTNANNSSINNKTDSSTDKLCAGKNLSKAQTLHDDDVSKIKERDDVLKTTTTTLSITSKPDGVPGVPGVEKLSSSSSATDNLTDFGKMSLNHNGVTARTDAINTVTTTATITTQQTRPLTLTTASAPSTTGISKGSKSPKTPNTTTGNHIITNTTIQTTPSERHSHSQQQQQQQHPHTHQHHNHHHHQHNHTSNCKTSPGSKLTPKTPPVTPDSPTTYLDDDLDSLFSYGTTTSGRSTMSCEHPYVARNGTTFSGRKMKYVVHCSNYAGQVGADYLTPTQRAQRQLRRLKELLCAARQDLEQKDSEILRLTREVVELRLFKASLSSPEERSASSDAVTVREAELKTSQDVSPIVDMVDDAEKTSSPRHHAHSSSVMLHQQHLPQSSLHHQQHMMHLSSDMQSSFADSGHFEDMTSSSVHSKDSSYTASLHTHDQACGGDEASCSPNASASSATVEQYEIQRQELIRLYEQRIEDLIRNQDAATSEIKRTNCDRIEALLQKLAECNTRYADIVPDYELAKERIRELEKQLEDLQRKLAEHEEKQKQMYLHMYQKGQEAERIARADQALELAHRAPQNKVSINELLHQLQSTQDELENIRTIYRRLLEAQKNRTHVDPEVTLQFLKSAVYYFLTDKENSQGHLQAIESILEFSEAEKQTINKARSAK